jgi:predicted ATPase
VPNATIELLGGFVAHVDGKPVPERAWRLRKARELVKLLALAPGQRLHREQAMDTFWRDKDPEAAANNLHQAVHVARRALGADALQLRDDLLRLSAQVDVSSFERAAADARRTGTPAAYRAALSLYKGELLPENRYDDWAEDRRSELTELHETLTDELAELGAISGLRGLPAETTSFIGRERELGELRALLGGTRLLTLTGAGGAGKTRLGLELARAVESSYDDGAVLAELAPVGDAGLVVDAVAVALDLRALPGRELAEAVAEFLSSRSLLLVLDNCEHVLGASASLVDTLLRAAPGLTIVATSRESLRVPGEIVFRVPSLAMPDPDAPLTPADLLAYESVRLFVERAAAAAPGFALDEENAGDVVRVCFRLDGLPLALELAAARLGALDAAMIAERLDDRFRLLRAGSRAAPTRQQTLEATLAWSHDLLMPDERVLLRRLAVFAGGFELAAVEEVCAGQGVDPRDVADVLGRLVEKSLVTIEDQGRKRRYRLLETVRLYASERLEEAGEATLRKRHADWALRLAVRDRSSLALDREAANLRVALDTLLDQDPGEALRLCLALWPFWLRRIDLEEAHRRFEHALAAVPERTAMRAEALLAAAALELRAGLLMIGAEHAHESLAVARELGDAEAEWRALHFLGGLAISNDEAGPAEEWFQRGLKVARREGLAAAEALCISSVGVARWRLGDLAAAEELVARSIDAFRRLGDPSERVPSPISLAEARSERGTGFEERIIFEDTLQPFVDVSCAAAIGHALVNQAGIVRDRGELGRARKLLEQSAALFLREGDDRGQADVLVRLAYLELADGSGAEARACLERALELRRSLGDRRGVGMALAGLGLVDTAADDHVRAERELGEALELFRRAGDRWGLTGALWNRADLAVARGDLDGAEAALEEALGVLREARRELWIAQTLVNLAETSLLRGEQARAEAFLAEARDLYQAKSDNRGAAEVERRLRALTEPLRER